MSSCQMWICQMWSWSLSPASLQLLLPQRLGLLYMLKGGRACLMLYSLKGEEPDRALPLLRLPQRQWHPEDRASLIRSCLAWSWKLPLPWLNQVLLCFACIVWSLPSLCCFSQGGNNAVSFQALLLIQPCLWPWLQVRGGRAHLMVSCQMWK